MAARRRPLSLPEGRRFPARPPRNAAAEVIARVTVIAALVAIVALVIVAQDLVALVALALATLLGAGLILLLTSNTPRTGR